MLGFLPNWNIFESSPWEKKKPNKKQDSFPSVLKYFMSTELKGLGFF